MDLLGLASHFDPIYKKTALKQFPYKLGQKLDYLLIFI